MSGPQAEPKEGWGRGHCRGRGDFGFFFSSCREKKKKEKEEKHEAGRAAFSFFFFSFFFSSGRRREKKTVNEKNNSDGGENKTRHKNQSHLERECPVSVGLSGQGDLQPPPTPHLCSFYDPGREGKGAGVGGAWAWKDSPPKWALGRPLYGWQAPCTPGSYKATGSGGQSECESR